MLLLWLILGQPKVPGGPRGVLPPAQDLRLEGLLELQHTGIFVLALAPLAAEGPHVAAGNPMTKVAALRGGLGGQPRLAQHRAPVVGVLHGVAAPGAHCGPFGGGCVGPLPEWVQSQRRGALLAAAARGRPHRHVQVQHLPVLVVNPEEAQRVREPVQLAARAQRIVLEGGHELCLPDLHGNVGAHVVAPALLVRHGGPQGHRVSARRHQVVPLPELPVRKGNAEAVQAHRLVPSVLDQQLHVLQLRQGLVEPGVHPEPRTGARAGYQGRRGARRCAGGDGKFPLAGQGQRLQEPAQRLRGLRTLPLLEHPSHRPLGLGGLPGVVVIEPRLRRWRRRGHLRAAPLPCVAGREVAGQQGSRGRVQHRGPRVEREGNQAATVGVGQGEGRSSALKAELGPRGRAVQWLPWPDPLGNPRPDDGP